MSTKSDYTPQAIFDSIDYLLASENIPAHVPSQYYDDYQYAKQFLLSYQHNRATFLSYRREIERFAQYSWFVTCHAMEKMQRADIEEYLIFCQKPPISWIARKKVDRFTVNKNGERLPNPAWRPFLVTISKSDRRQGKSLRRNQYRLSEKGFKEIFTILNCYYNFLIQEERTGLNPIIQIKQKSRFYQTHQSKTKIRRVSEYQWKTIIETAEQMTEREPEKHERTLFMISALYSMYLRISELAASPRWTPTMNDFSKDHEGRWWFTTVGKGNKERLIAVSPSMLTALKRWRKHLQLTPSLPTVSDDSPLLPKRGHGAITDTGHIRKIIQSCFDLAIIRLEQRERHDDAAELGQATVHWLRHTGISDDVKIRPREHVRDDAGHSSSSITDKYIDIHLHERHNSAKNKTMKPKRVLGNLV